MRFLFLIKNLRPFSLCELLTKLPWTCARIGRGLSWQHGGPAVCCAAQVLWWLSCVYLRFGAPYRWLLGAPNPLLQLKTGCGFRLPVNGCSELRTHDWVEIGVSSCCLLRVCNNCGMQQHVSAGDMLKCSTLVTHVHPARFEPEFFRIPALHPARIELTTFSVLG